MPTIKREADIYEYKLVSQDIWRKLEDKLKESLKLVDAVIEIRDARIVKSRC